MRYGPAARRPRNNNGSNNRGGHNQGQQQRRGFQNKNKVFDSNGPDVRIRGTAYQIVEKYQALAKDAASAGDRVLAESYLQYIEHYQRVINSWEDEYAPDPFDPNYQESFATYDIRVAERKARQEAEAEAENDGMVESDDLGLPSSLVAERPVQREMSEA